MSSLPSRRSHARLAAFSVLIISVLGAVPAFAESPESVVRRFLELAYEGRFEALPASDAVRMERFERQVRNVLRVRCIRVEQVSVTLLPKNEQEVTAHAEITIEKRDPMDPREWFAIESVPLRLELVRQEDSWLIAEVHNRDEELAEQLFLAGGDERERLLRRQPERVSRGLARASYGRAMALLGAGKLKEGASASALAREIAIMAGDRGGEALALGAATYSAPESAPRLSMESLAIAETLDEPDVLGRAWYDRGRSIQGWDSRSAVQVAERMECFRKARKFAERAEDPIILIRALYSLANAAANGQSDYLAARRYIDEGMPIAKEVGDLAGEMGFETVLTTLYANQDDRERARIHHTRAMELAKSTQAYAYPTLLIRAGCMLVGEGRPDEARAALARIVTRNETGVTTTIGSVPGPILGNGLRCMARIEAESGNLAEAECLNRESARHHGGSPNAYLFELARFYSGQGNHAHALAFSLASLAESGLYANQQMTALVEAGRAYRSLGAFEQALSVALEAIEIREAVDLRTSGDERQRALASGMTSECYELAAEVALDREAPVQALAFLERGRARVLMEILENGRPGSIADSDTALQERQAALERDVVRISIDLDRARAIRDERSVASLSEQLRRVRAVHATYVDGLEARSERQRTTRRQVDAAELLHFGAQLPSRTVAVEYFIGEHDLHIFVIDRDRVIVRTKKVERKVMEQHVNAFLEMLALNDLRVEAAGREIFSLLVEPIEREIAGADALVVVPDDVLWRVPFAALVDRGGRFLVESKAIVYAPSMTAFSSIANSRRRREWQQVSLFAVGNPTLDQAAVKAAADFYRDTTLGPLPDAEHEVDAVRALYDSRRSLVLKREQATETRTKSALPEASVVHFATHAILDDGNPMYSRLMLAHDANDSNDGWLEGWEVARLDLHADLVVLSACDTARGRVGGGEGVVGLSWSFFLAGASSTLATQWKVASDSTAQFMIAFHRSLRASAVNPALHKAQSLRKAQLELIHDKRTRHPFHWAPFVLLGDPSVAQH